MGQRSLRRLRRGRLNQYDGFGRVIREYRLLPNNLGGSNGGSNFAIRDTKYDTADNKTFVSEWTPCNPSTVGATNIGYCAIGISSQVLSTGTTYSGFDVFGRPAGTNAILRADGTTTTISYSDGSTLASDLYESVTVNNVGGVAATTVTRKDPVNRVYSVEEPTGDTTTYAYNVLAKLATVTEGVQTRSFVYDQNGFLRSETNPEDGLTGNGQVSYATYDALGDVLSKTDGDVTYTATFDQEGRQTTLQTNLDPIVVTSFYDGLGGWNGGSYPNGHVTLRIGQNQGTITTPTIIPVTERFSYGNTANANGRVTSIETLVGDSNGDLSTDQTETIAYNAFGLPATKTHPTPVGGSALAETIVYGAGLPTMISTTNPTATPVYNATYSAAGALATWRAGSSTGTLTTITPDVIPTRPARVFTSDSGGLNTGTYAYDGAGNILSMTVDSNNSDTFGYDARSRVTSAAYKVAGATTSQGFTYDRYGNLTGVTGTGNRSLSTDVNTNILCDPNLGCGTCPGSGCHLTQRDARGNLNSYLGETLYFDKLNRLYDDVNNGVEWGYAFAGSGERVGRLQVLQPVTRREMAVEIVQSRGDSAATGCGTPHFSDVLCSDADWG